MPLGVPKLRGCKARSKETKSIDALWLISENFKWGAEKPQNTCHERPSPDRRSNELDGRPPFRPLKPGAGIISHREHKEAVKNVNENKISAHMNCISSNRSENAAHEAPANLRCRETGRGRNCRKTARPGIVLFQFHIWTQRIQNCNKSWFFTTRCVACLVSTEAEAEAF